VTLLDAPEPPSRVPSNSLSPDSVARLVSAATVAARLAVELGLEVLLAATPAALAAAAVFSADAALDALRRLDRADTCPLLMLPIDIMNPHCEHWNLGYRPGFSELEKARSRSAGGGTYTAETGGCPRVERP
jgi:hypothetical protein